MALLVFWSLVAIGLYELSEPLCCWANDGGFSENNNNLLQALQQGAVPLLIYSTVGAVVAAGGGAVGAALGTALGGPSTGPAGTTGGQTATPADIDRINNLNQAIEDPALYGRIQSLIDQLNRTGHFDPNELNAIDQAQQQLADQRHAQIVDQQQQATDEWNQQRQANAAAEQAQAAANAAQQDRLRGKLVDLGRQLVGGVDDPNRQQFYNDFLNRHSGSPEDLRQALQALQTQMSAAGDKAASDGEWIGAYEGAARDIRDWSLRVNRAAANFIPGGDRIVAAQQGLYGTVEGYEQGGLAGAARRATAAALDPYTHGMATPLYNSGGDPVQALEARTRGLNPATYVHDLQGIATAAEEGNVVDALGRAVDTVENATDAAKDAKNLTNKATGKSQPSEGESGNQAETPPEPAGTSAPASPPETPPPAVPPEPPATSTPVVPGGTPLPAAPPEPAATSSPVVPLETPPTATPPAASGNPVAPPETPPAAAPPEPTATGTPVAPAETPPIATPAQPPPQPDYSHSPGRFFASDPNIPSCYAEGTVLRGGQTEFQNGELVRRPASDYHPDGEVWMSIKNEYPDPTAPNGVGKSAVLPGHQMFNEVLQHFNGQFGAVRAEWTPELPANLNKFNQLTAQGVPPEQAATQTWTGQQAARHGFTAAKIRNLDGTPGAHTKVEVTFYDPDNPP